MEKLHEKAIAATARFCERKGCRIIEVGWKSPAGRTADIIAEDGDGTICFVDVSAREASEAGFSDRRIPRREWEMLALSWLMGHEVDTGVGVRFDSCEILVTDDFRALLKYHEAAIPEG